MLRGLDQEAYREPEAGSDVVVFIVAGVQNNPGELYIAAEIDHDPFLLALLLAEAAVIPIGRALLLQLDLCGVLRDRLIENGQLVPASGDGPLPVLPQLSANPFELRAQLLTLLRCSRVPVVGTLRPVNGGENILQAEVVVLGKGIELMIVAAGALNRQAGKGVDGVGDHLISVDVASHLAVDLGFGHFDVTDEVPGSSGDKSQAENAIGLPGKENISRELLLHKP